MAAEAALDSGSAALMIDGSMRVSYFGFEKIALPLLNAASGLGQG